MAKIILDKELSYPYECPFCNSTGGCILGENEDDVRKATSEMVFNLSINKNNINQN